MHHSRCSAPAAAVPHHCHPAVYTSSVGKETLVTVVALCIWPIIIEATKSLNKGQPESVPLFPWNEPWKAQQ